MSRNRQRTYVAGPGRRLINRGYTFLTRLGLGASYRQLLTVTGQRTGLPRTTPSYIARVPVTRSWWSVRDDASDAELQVEAALHPVFRLDPALDDAAATFLPARGKGTHHA